MFAWVQPAHVAAGTIASAATIVAQSAVRDGVDETTGWALGVIAAGVAVFRFMDSRQQNAAKEIASQRRKDDEATQQRIATLEAEVEHERQITEQLRAQHAATVAELTERIITLLSQPPR